MIEVHEKLYVGAESDEHQTRGQPGWFVIHACKEPYHRQALNYTGRAASKDHPEYLLARRNGCLILNLVDVDDVNFIRTEIIDAALDAIHDNINTSKVLVHCNQGQSRSPTIAFLYMRKYTEIFHDLELSKSLFAFRKIYPLYNPARGMAEYVRLNWQRYST